MNISSLSLITTAQAHDNAAVHRKISISKKVQQELVMFLGIQALTGGILALNLHRWKSRLLGYILVLRV